MMFILLILVAGAEAGEPRGRDASTNSPPD
jgi:hypothetical protein